MLYGDTQIKRAFVSATASGNTELVAVVAGKLIRALAFYISAAGAVVAKFQSGTTDISGSLDLSDGTPAVAPFIELGWFQTAVGEALNLNLDAAVTTPCHILYVEL